MRSNHTDCPDLENIRLSLMDKYNRITFKDTFMKIYKSKFKGIIPVGTLARITKIWDGNYIPKTMNNNEREVFLSMIEGD